MEKMEKKIFEVLGLREEKIFAKLPTGFNGKFKKVRAELSRHIFCMKSEGKLYELSLWMKYGICTSGYATDCRACCELSEVSEFATMTHSCKPSVSITLTDEKNNIIFEEYDIEGMEEGFIENEIFFLSPIGGNQYLYEGEYDIQWGKFTPLNLETQK
ncbi:MAG: hypothetical protein RSE50_12930 [Myroides sp.]